MQEGRRNPSPLNIHPAFRQQSERMEEKRSSSPGEITRRKNTTRNSQNDALVDHQGVENIKKRLFVTLTDKNKRWKMRIWALQRQTRWDWKYWCLKGEKRKIVSGIKKRRGKKMEEDEEAGRKEEKGKKIIHSRLSHFWERKGDAEVFSLHNVWSDRTSAKYSTITSLFSSAQTHTHTLQTTHTEKRASHLTESCRSFCCWVLKKKKKKKRSSSWRTLSFWDFKRCEWRRNTDSR